MIVTRKIDKSLTEVSDRSCPDNLKKDGPSQEVAFWWTELVSFWELKLVRKDLSKCVAGDISTRNRSSSESSHFHYSCSIKLTFASAVTPATLKPPAGGPSAESNIRKPRLKRSPARSHTMSTRKFSVSVGASLSTSIFGSGSSSTLAFVILVPVPPQSLDLGFHPLQLPVQSVPRTPRIRIRRTNRG